MMATIAIWVSTMTVAPASTFVIHGLLGSLGPNGRARSMPLLPSEVATTTSTSGLAL
ncbi:hypothetical protein [Nocardioides sp.]|uniref:hypothetical protein n=1 Tax=Nocardioides sp. TaxID=35761 RepID=UPI002C4271A1|nr:hypothetical protein [Nocardioides sp.]HXH78757.1 hypothetical protein [Nocardioides sp.]